MSATPPDIATLYLATIVTIDDHGACRPAHQLAPRRGKLGRRRLQRPRRARARGEVPTGRGVPHHGDAADGARVLRGVGGRAGGVRADLRCGRA